MRIEFSRAVAIDENDLVLTNLGVDAPNDADSVITLTDTHVQVSGATLTIYSKDTIPVEGTCMKPRSSYNIQDTLET